MPLVDLAFGLSGFLCEYDVFGCSISGDIQRRRWAVFGFFPAIVLLRYPKASPTALAIRE
jgi:hypothetical protein